MATVSMLLLIVGAGGILLGLGWVFSDGPHLRNAKPALWGIGFIAIALVLPLNPIQPSPSPVAPTPTPKATNVPDLELATWPTIATRLQFACATNQKGTPSCWGEAVAMGDQPLVGIALGREHGCVLRTTGEAECWGEAKSENDRLKNERFVALASTLETTCGITSTGTLDCWGDPMDWPKNNPNGFRAISGGAAHFCALDTTNEVTCWGTNEEGQATPPTGPFNSISAGHFHTCAIGMDSKVDCWGRNVEGQSMPPDTRFRQISSGWEHTCGIDQSGRLLCWGCESKSTAVNLQTNDQCKPPKGQFLAVSSGDMWKSCAITTSGQINCWGGLNYAGAPQ